MLRNRRVPGLVTALTLAFVLLGGWLLLGPNAVAQDPTTPGAADDANSGATELPPTSSSGLGSADPGPLDKELETANKTSPSSDEAGTQPPLGATAPQLDTATKVLQDDSAVPAHEAGGDKDHGDGDGHGGPVVPVLLALAIIMLAAKFGASIVTFQ